MLDTPRCPEILLYQYPSSPNQLHKTVPFSAFLTEVVINKLSTAIVVAWGQQNILRFGNEWSLWEVQWVST